MKFYTNKKYNKLLYFLTPLGALFIICLAIFQGRDLTNILISNIVFFILYGFVIYTTYKQSTIPLMEIKNDILLINDINLGKKEITLDSIAGFKKYLLGHKLLTLGGDVIIPTGSLSKTDRELFLNNLKLKI